MKIGIDFDNTTACYEGIFHQLALEKELIPETLPTNKDAVRDYLRIAGQEDIWTEMQGFVYGPGISRARLFPGLTSFILACREKEFDIVIVSHKTRHPFKGPAYDLHTSAREWLRQNGCFKSISDGGMGFKEEDVFFELTKEQKCERITEQKCDYFVDDLPELLTDSCFPKSVRKLLFSPYLNEDFSLPKEIEKSFSSWQSIKEWLLV